MMGTGTTNVVIVYTDKTKEYAEYLKNLISLNDDTDDSIVGIKDGSVKATTRHEKKFIAENDSSAQKVIFIGDCKSAESVRRHARWKIDVHGLRCGWFGNQAILYVNKTIKKKDEYDSFFKFGKEIADRLNVHINEIKESTGQKIGKAFSVIGLIAWVPIPFVGIPGAANLILQASKRAKEINWQQYDALVGAFYLNYLQSFIEGNA